MRDLGQEGIDGAIRRFAEGMVSSREAVRRSQTSSYPQERQHWVLEAAWAYDAARHAAAQEDPARKLPQLDLLTSGTADAVVPDLLAFRPPAGQLQAADLKAGCKSAVLSYPATYTVCLCQQES
jgi:hypothetical protein